MRRVAVGAMLLALASCRGGPSAPGPLTDDSAPAFSRRLPLSFESNLGQAPPEVRYLARNGAFALFVTDRQAVVAQRQSDGNVSVVRMVLAGESRAGTPEALDLLPGKSHYFRGRDPAGWIRNVPHHGRVALRGVYDGIDLVYHASGGRLEFDFVVEPGADPTAIALAFPESTVTFEGDDLVVASHGAQLIVRAPLSFQEVAGARKVIASRFVRRADGGVGFEAAEYDRGRPLVIDPVLHYAVSFGGVFADRALDVAVDASGNSYLTGGTYSIEDFPLVAPHDSMAVFSPDPSGAVRPDPVVSAPEAFVTKLSADGTTILFSTFLGGSGFDEGRGIALDSSGAPVIVGDTSSIDFATTPGAFQTTYGGTQDAFVTKLSADGSSLVYSTYLGGEGDDVAFDVALDAAARPHLTGFTHSDVFPTAGSIAPRSGVDQPFVSRLSANGQMLLYSTLLGQSENGTGRGHGIAVDALGAAYVTGVTQTTAFQVSPIAFQPTTGGGPDAFVLKLDVSGAFSYGSYLGGSGSDRGNGIGIDNGGRAFLTGATGSCDLLTTVSAPQPASLDCEDAFFAVVSPEGDALRQATYLGGSEPDAGEAIAVDATGRASLAGWTHSSDFPRHHPLEGVQNFATPTKADAFLALLGTSSILGYSTTIGGAYDDKAFAVALDASLVATLAGVIDTNRPPEPAQPEGLVLPPETDVFVVRIGPQTAEDDAYAVLEDASLSVPAPGVLTNDLAVTRAQLAASPTNAASFALSTDGAFSYVPATNFFGVDTFRYRAGTGAFLSSAATVTITVTAQPDPPVAVADAYAVESDTPLTVAAPGVLANDTDPDGDSLTAILTAAPASGTLSLASNGSFTYTPAAGFFGTDSFQYQADDGTSQSPAATVSLSVAPETTITSGPPAAVSATAVTFAFSSSDPLATFECRLDAEPFADCTSPHTVGPPLAEQMHLFEVRAVGVSGTDPSAAAYSFTIDRTAPILSLLMPSDGSSHATTPIDITVQASEDVVVTASSAFASGTSLLIGDTTVSLALGSGYNTFTTFFRDAAGNSGALTFHLFLDNTPPQLSFLSPSSGSSVHYQPANVLVSLSETVTVVTATPSGWLGVADGATLQGGERTLSLVLSTGDNAFEATLSDAAGNPTVYAGPTAFHLSLLAQGPPSPEITSPPDNTVTTSRQVTVSGTVPAGNATSVRICGATCVTVPVNGGAWSGAVDLPRGVSRIRVVSLNDAGAASAEDSNTITAETSRLVSEQSGDLQIAVAGQAPAAPLVAIVTDLAGNAVSGVTVTFTIAQEPYSGDAFLGGAGKTFTAPPTGVGGTASVTVTTGTTECRDAPPADCVIQPTVVEAHVDGQLGGPAVFRVQGLLSGRFLAPLGLPEFAIPLNTDCSPGPGPTGQCPLGEVGTSVPGFALLILDGAGRIVPDHPVTFTATIGNFGSATGPTSAAVTTGPDGVARSGDFWLHETIDAPAVPCTGPSTENPCVMLHPEDETATVLRRNPVAATTQVFPGGTPADVSRGFNAYAHAGEPTAITDVSTSAAGSFVQLPADGTMEVRVTDLHGNPVSNASVYFQATGPSVSPDPGPLVFRANADGSSALECAYVMTHGTDPCAAPSLSATTFVDGKTWAQMILGKRTVTPYTIRASAGSPFVDFVRTTGSLPITLPSQTATSIQSSYTLAGVFAITDTENDDTDPVTAVVWRFRCDDVEAPIGTCDGTFNSGRYDGKTVTFETRLTASPATPGTGTFNPPSAVMGNQTFLYPGSPVQVTPPEVAAFLKGGPDPSSAESYRIASNPSILGAVTYADPEATFELKRVTLGCATDPLGPSPRTLCEPESALPNPGCQEALPQPSDGVLTYIDLLNGETENNVLVLKVKHPSAMSPVAGRLVAKFKKKVQAKKAGLAPLDYYQEVPGAAGRPGLYDISGVRLGPGPAAGALTVFGFGTEHHGCYEFIAKSYKRNLDATATVEPANAQFSLEFADGTLIGGPIEMPGNSATPGRGWADEIRRERQHPAEGIQDADLVADWVQMRAWRIYKNPHPGNIDELADPFQAAGVKIVVGEPAVVSTSVGLVSSKILPLGVRAETKGGDAMKASGVWSSSPTEIVFNTREPDLRTDGPHNNLSEAEAGLRFDVVHFFSYLAMHESRHAWHRKLLVKTGAPFTEHEALFGLPDRNPDNNDDLVFYNADGSCCVTDASGFVIVDRLPEKALLPDGSDLGGPTGSAGEILDSASNREFGSQIKGELPASSAQADQTLETSVTSTRMALERDAARYGRALEKALRP